MKKPGSIGSYVAPVPRNALEWTLGRAKYAQMDDAKPEYIKRFIAADLPDADETVVGIMAVVAREREKIAQRTREALAVARRRLARDGRALGQPKRSGGPQESPPGRQGGHRCGGVGD